MKRNAILGAILEFLEEAGDVSAAILMSAGSSRLAYKNLREIKKEKLQKALYRLKYSGYIQIRNKDAETQFTLTEKGRGALHKHTIDSIKLRDEAHWNGIWHVASFDIPERFKKGRNALSYKFKDLGAYPLQKSIYVYPYRFKEEVYYIAELFGVKEYVFYWEVKSINIENQLKKVFGLP